MNTLLWLSLIGILQVARLNNYQDSVLFELRWDHPRRWTVRLNKPEGEVVVRFPGVSYRGPREIHRTWPLLREIQIQTSSAGTTIRYRIPTSAFRFYIHPVLGGVAMRILAAPDLAATESKEERHRIRRVVIDAGHGGKDPGAIGYRHIREKDLTLRIALKTARALKRLAPDLQIKLTRASDRFISLAGRGELANQWGADLFISIHCNYSRNRRTTGVETYFLSEARTAWARAVANAENGALKYEMEGNTFSGDILKMILSDLAQNAFLKESQDLAVRIHEQLVRLSRSRNRGVRQAGFYVLYKAYMPAVLVEVGFISNPQEARKLSTPSYQQAVAEGIARGILDFIRDYNRNGTR